MTESVVPANRERVATVFSGWTMLPISLLLFFGGIALFITSLVMGQRGQPVWDLLIIGVLSFIAAIISFPGFFTLQPNEARVLVLFGDYRGTVRQSGFHWANPFYARGLHYKGQSGQTPPKGGEAAVRASMVSRFRISLRVRNMMSDRLKVNDKRGNPIEIAAVVVGACTTPPRRCSMWMTTRTTSASRASRPFATSPAAMPTTMARSTKSRCGAAWMKSPKPCGRNCRSGSTRPA